MADDLKTEFEQKKGRWLAENPNFLERKWDDLCFVWFNTAWFQFSWYKFPYFLGQLGLAASGPVIGFYTADLLSLWTALYIFIGLLVFLLITKYLAGIPKRREGRITRPIQTIWIRFGNLLNTIKSGATPAGQKDASIDFTLALATSLAAQITGIQQQKFAASLLLYEGEGKSQMRVKHRDRGSERPIDRPVNDLDTVLGHHACESGKAPRVVADMRRFGEYAQKSPTQSRPNYRSIFLQPVVSSQNGAVSGFLSVDCTVPHAFHRDRAVDLAALLEPLKAHIEDMI